MSRQRSVKRQGMLKKQDVIVGNRMLERHEGHKLRQIQKSLIHHSELEIYCVSTQSYQQYLTGKKISNIWKGNVSIFPL